MKKILLLFLLFIPFVVHAEVKITNIEEINKSDDVISKHPSYKDLDINFDITFNEVEDFIKYKVTINNDTKKDYEINTGIEFSNKENIKYETTMPDNKSIIKANTEEIVYITITYNKKVDNNLFKAGIYTEQNNMSINLSNDTKNPNTSTGYITVAVVLLVISLIIMIKYHNYKIYHFTLPILILLLPITILALETLTININTNITIQGNEKLMTIINNYCDLKPSETEDIKYLDGMTINDLIGSDYFNSISNDMKSNFERKLTLYAYNKDFVHCVQEVEYQGYNYNMTPEEQEKYERYITHYRECQTEYPNSEKEISYDKDTILSQDTTYYRFHSCE